MLANKKYKGELEGVYVYSNILHCVARAHAKSSTAATVFGDAT